MQSFDLSRIAWQEVAADGSKYALLEGDKTVPGGCFSYLFFLPAGLWDRPHWHTGDARILVLQGALKVGRGPVFDKGATRLYPAQSLLVVPRDEIHFDGADIDTLVFGVATGPWETRYTQPG
ncbi:MAG: cupin domain-containing protein [Telmatospirillum sp.]|nr:cupin domain-containing protein [Telmatospirillum sp.]